jgi:hypothetical protein
VRWSAVGLALLIAGRGAAAGQPLAGDSDAALVLALKSSLVVARAPEDRRLYPEPTGAASLWQLRLEGRRALSADLAAGAAWQCGLQVSSGGASGAGLLPAGAPVAYRIRPLDWAVGAQRQALAWRQGIDRLWVSADAGPARVVLGRQAVGWGRGALLGAVDVFAPFGALEADREWRPGVDAARVDLKLGQHLAADAVAAFGARLDRSAFGARLRGFRGDVDAELVGGWRAGDAFAGLTASAALGDVELHGEAAAFLTGEAWPGALGGARRVVPAAVAGISWRAPAGNGIYVLAEVHHTGFGLASAGEVPTALADPERRDRLLRGDAQTLGRDTAALMLSYEANELLTATLTVFQSLQDGSGIAAPGASLGLSDRLVVKAELYPSWGARPEGGVPRSFWGTTPFAAYLQVAVYD